MALTVSAYYAIANAKVSAEDESNDLKYTVFNYVKSYYAHFIRLIFAVKEPLPSWTAHYELL